MHAASTQVPNKEALSEVNQLYYELTAWFKMKPGPVLYLGIHQILEFTFSSVTVTIDLFVQEVS